MFAVDEEAERMGRKGERKKGEDVVGKEARIRQK